jgi:hypothetical protein
MPFSQHPTDPNSVIYKPNDYWIPKQWVGLTDEQLSKTYNELYTQYTRDDVNIADFILIARTIESKLRSENNA